MTILYETKYKKISLIASDSLLITQWKTASLQLTEDIFKTEIINWLDQVKKYSPQRLLIDTRNFKFILIPEIQEWFAQEVFTVYPATGVQKKAFLVADDFISQVALEQHIENVTNQTFKVAFYESEEDALAWLTS